MIVNNSNSFESWKIARRKTFLSFCFLTCVLGTEYSVIIPSLWFYISDIAQTKEASKYYYGAILSAYYVSAIAGSFFITKYIDSTRNVRKTMLTLITFEVIGNILYSIPVSPLMLLFGRLIQGLGDVNMSIMTAEIARSFISEEVTGKIATIVACFSTTFVIAPALNIGFKYVDFSILSYRIYFGNLPGLFMIILFSIAFGVVYTFVEDLSKLFDLKEHLNSAETADIVKELSDPIESQNGDTDLQKNILPRQNVVEEECKQLINSPEQLKNKKSHLILLKSFDFPFLVALGFLMSFSMVAFLDVSMPILAANYFHFSSQTTGLMFFATGLLFIIVLQIVKWLSKRCPEFYVIFMGLAAFMISICQLFVVTLIDGTYFKLRLGLFCSYVLILGTCSCVEQVLVRSILCKIIPSSCQTFAEGIRRSASSLACIISSMFTPLFVKKIEYLCIVVVGLTLSCCLILLARKKTLVKPKTIKML